MRRGDGFTILHFAFPVILVVVVALIVCNFFFKQYNIEFMDEESVYDTVKTSGLKEIDLPTPPTKDGWDFEGWFFDNVTFENEFTSTSFEKKRVTEDIKVYAKWSEHYHVEGTWVISEQATCTSTGLETLSCVDCKKVIDSKIIEKKAHTPKAAVKEREVKPTCVSVGTYFDVVYCSTCNFKISETAKEISIDPSAHSFDEKSSVNFIAPMVDGSYDSFYFEGVCRLCSANIYKDHISLKVNYEHECLSEGKAEYTYEICNSKFTYTRTIPAEEHVLKGMPASYWAETVVIGDDEVVYYSTTLDEIIIKGEGDYACGDFAPAVFVCETCDKSVQVQARYDHVGKWTVVTEATCTSDGEASINCSVCKTTVKEPIPKHNFEYSVTDEKVITVNGSKKITTYNLIGVCSAYDCSEVHVVENVSYKFTKTPSCLNRGQIEYVAFSIPDQKFNVVAATKSHSILDDSSGKNLLASEIENKDGSINSSYSNLQYIAGSSTDCGLIVQGLYTCSVCQQPVIANIFNVHNGIWVDDENNPPNCTDYGKQYRQCFDCSAIEERIIAPLGHEYNYELVLTKNGTKNTFEVVGTCVRINCDSVVRPLTKDKVTSGVSKKVLVTGNCGVQGVNVYSYTYTEESTNIVYNLECNEYIEPTGNHKFPNGALASNVVDKSTGTFDYTKYKNYLYLFAQTIECEDIVQGYYTCKTCDKYVLVDVKKSHKGTWKVVTEATCYNVGLRTMDCEYCGKVEEEIPMKLHTYSASLSSETVTEEVNGSEEQRYEFTLSAKCTVEECGYVRPDQIVTPDVKKKVTSPTCSEEGFTTYSFSKELEDSDGRKHKFSVSCQLDFTERSEHTLCGKNPSTLMEADGTFLSSIDGIILSEECAGLELKDGDIVDGGYVCEKCGRFIKVRVTIDGTFYRFP